MSVVASILLGVTLPAQATNPLHELQSSRGSVVIGYERATGGNEAFARLASSSPTVVVTVAEGTPEQAGRQVAGAYAEGLRTLFPDVVLASSRDVVKQADYVVEVGIVTGSEIVEGSEMVYSTRQTGVTCKAMPDNTVACMDAGAAPIAVGKRATEETESKVAVTIRFLQPQTGAGRAALFEEAYSLRIPEQACKHGISAAVTVASALGRAALSQEPLNLKLYSSPGLLRCERKPAA
jgi:hypothetical protein